MADARSALRLVAGLRKALGLPLEDFARSNAYGAGAIHANRTYGRLSALSALHDPALGPATYFADEDGIVLVYLPELDIRPERLLKEFGQPAARWRSRAGKQYLHHVLPGNGLAFSCRRGGKDVQLLEVFRPCSLHEYEAAFYDDPGPFVE